MISAASTADAGLKTREVLTRVFLEEGDVFVPAEEVRLFGTLDDMNDLLGGAASDEDDLALERGLDEAAIANGQAETDDEALEEIDDFRLLDETDLGSGLSSELEVDWDASFSGFRQDS